MIERLTTNVESIKQELNTRMDTLEARSTPATPLPTLQIPSPQATPQITASTTPAPTVTQSEAISEDKRWRPEEIGYFDGTGDVYAYVDRIRTVSSKKTGPVVQTHLVTVLQETAWKWYHRELSDDTRKTLTTSPTVDEWCEHLIARFKKSLNELMAQLEACHYTRKDAASRKDATAFVQDILGITKGLKWPQKDSLMTAFHHFEPNLQRDLDPPSGDITAFMKQVQLRQNTWYQVYSSFGKPRPPDPRPLSNQPMRSQNPYSQRPQYRAPPPRQTNPYRQSPAPPPPQPNGYQTRPQQAYWADEEDDDWIYDPPSDAYYIPEPLPTNHGPGHTPRRLGNTHDAGGSEAMANWASAGEEHRCSHQGCTHYH